MAMDRTEAGMLADPDEPHRMDAGDVRNVLKDLIETAIDGERGYMTAADDLEDPMRAELFRTLGKERGTFAAELANVGARFGVEYDPEGTVTAGLHRGWIKVKNALTTGDHAIVEAAEEGEEHAADQYAEALEQPLPDDVKTVVRRQYEQISEALDKVRTLAERTE